jgi:hypothetical protein
LRLRDRLVDPIGEVSRTLAELDDRVAHRLKGILDEDRPALWDVEVPRSLSEELRQGGFDSAQARLDRFAEYVGDNGIRLAWQAVLFVALVIGLRRLGASALKLAQADDDLFGPARSSRCR